MILAVFAGSFDPPTYGHLNVIERAGRLFDRIHIVIAVNRKKKYLFSTEERLDMMRELVKPFSGVSVHLWDRLIVDYAKEHNAQILLRGVRNSADFSYELELSMMNRGLNPDIETVFIPTDPKYVVIRSSAIKEVASFGGDISSMVPDSVKERLKMKFLQKTV
ncbi:MAG: pantetheine-phosphate adenylyltransferase [Spirochaetaceae bacterium]|jgi:pantetheine-phosphate adenylyltransferase|nr:pantetheine-phosphate adenylyltransferase [Spirochaetaceae bacterium]